MASAKELIALDPDNVVDIDLGGDYLRNHARDGIFAEWGQRRPFYVVNEGIVHVVVGRHADLRTVHIDAARFSSEIPKQPGYERFDYADGAMHIGAQDGKDHDRVRAAFDPYFGPKAIKQLRQSAEQIIEKMLDEVEALGGPFDAYQDFSYRLIERILIEGTLGITNPEHQAAFRRLQHELEVDSNIKPGQARSPDFNQSFIGVVNTINAILEERRAHPRENDLFTGLVKRMDEAGLITHEEIVANLLATLSGGQGTTAAVAAAMLTNLCKHRGQFDEIIADRSLIPDAVEECLRYQTSGLYTFVRFATCDTELGGTLIAKGTPVLVSPQAANYDPIKYPDPLKFDIHRKARDITTFGTGTHFCLGNRLARMILAIVLDKVCTRFPNLYNPEPDFKPEYCGIFGEMRMIRAPLHTGK
ncbi:cytochrome P450 [Sphingomonas populi]|uniref:Cytochrome P450 n=1 Tax=Sphingomonas populi TaxID=2484750 RepID=A0A4V2DDE7_9SPHN|nr:cytochrome P450 [Sphingomonas populi]RZF64728.1 cytochrome P450 [Sphingomonas populi]